MSVQQWFARGLEMLFGGYRRQVNVVDRRQPSRPERSISVAVVGSGLAGLSAAIELADRGYDVHIFEKNEYLGGKVGSWEVTSGQRVIGCGGMGLDVEGRGGGDG